MYLETVILHSHARIQQSRSIAAIYHLIKGKKGIQTVHDARIFQLDSLYGIYKNISKPLFDKKITFLLNQQFIEEISKENNQYRPTKKGLNWLEDHRDIYQLNHFHGLKYHKIDSVFLQRLQLAIQTYTNLKMKETSFIPITDSQEVTSFVKKFYNRMASFSPEDMLKLIYQDIKYILSFLNDSEAHFFLDQMTGYQSYGMTSMQLAKTYALNKDDVSLLRTAVVHQILNIIEKEKASLHILPYFISHEDSNDFITASTEKTYQLLYQGYTIEEIASTRRLKLNTIYDHVVEIALFDPSFSISRYVSQSAASEIEQAIRETKSYKLKDIKNKVSDSINYFQIRLVLTRTSHHV